MWVGGSLVIAFWAYEYSPCSCSCTQWPWNAPNRHTTLLIEEKSINLHYSKTNSHLVSIRLGLRLGSCNYQFTFLVDLKYKCTISLLFLLLA